jgi:hypothetical protein
MPVDARVFSSWPRLPVEDNAKPGDVSKDLFRKKAFERTLST